MTARSRSFPFDPDAAVVTPGQCPDGVPVQLAVLSHGPSGLAAFQVYVDWAAAGPASRTRRMRATPAERGRGRERRVDGTVSALGGRRVRSGRRGLFITPGNRRGGEPGRIVWYVPRFLVPTL